MERNLYIYILLMAGTTYLIRMLPIVFTKRQIQNRFLRSFLYYVPFVCLAAMTFPAILTSTDSVISAAVGFAAALLLAYKDKSLITVALCACGAVFITERLLELFARLPI